MTLAAEQLAAHEAGIGSSDCAAALGLSPWKTRLELYLEKTGEVERENLDEVERIQWGKILEDPIAREFARRRGVRVQRVSGTARHPEHSFIVSHVDRRIVGMNRALECKNVGHFYGMAEFGEPGTDEIPDEYLLQCHHQITVDRWEAVELAALIGGNHLRAYLIEPDEELAAVIVAGLIEFWRCVTERIPPAPVNVRDLSLLFAEDDGSIKSVDAGVYALWERYHAAKQDRAAVDRELEQIRDELRFAIAEAAGIQLAAELTTTGPRAPGIEYAGLPLATWRAEPRRTFDRERLRKERPEIYREYIEQTRTRVLRVTNPIKPKERSE